MKGLTMTRTDVEAHQRKHGFSVLETEERLAPGPAAGARGSKLPNKTEREFGAMLEARKRRSELNEYLYEGLTLRWGDGMRYTPDYVVWARGEIIIMEVKNAHIWDRDLVRFKGCRAEWKHRFRFEMHQKKGGQWTQIQ